MAIEFKMPPLGASLEEVSLVRWLVKIGDEIAKGAVVAEAETDKALVDIECPHSGRIGKIIVGDATPGVRIGSTLAIILAPGEHLDEESDVFSRDQSGGGTVATSLPHSTLIAPTVRGTIGTSTEHSKGNGGRILASPLARRLAVEAGLSLGGIRGTGPGGRIVRCDIESQIIQRSSEAVSVVTSSAVESGSVMASTESPSSDFEEIPHSAMRRTIALRLSEAKRSVPHFYLTIDCDIDALQDLRRSLNETLAGEGKTSVNDFVIKAVAFAMRKVSAVNASWTESAIRKWRSCDVSMAVATPGGLITPVIRDVDIKSIAAIAAESQSLAERARAARLKPEEYQGGGFTVSNLGMYGIQQFAAIVNPPQSCILAVGSGEQRPVVRGGQLRIATMMTCTLSVDHRVVDGAVAAEFLSVFRKLIEQPLQLLV